ncbi:MAG: alpha/beta fold hydrolase [Spirosomataceae bacterium]
MKKLVLGCIFLIMSLLTVQAQEVIGDWNGALQVTEKVQLRLVVHIVKSENGIKATMDSPDQGAKGIPISKASFENSVLNLEIPAAQIQYNGTYEGDKIKGTFKQGGKEFSLVLTKGTIATEAPKRPQVPQKPYPYYEEELSFPNTTANITLAGTLTLPQKEGVFTAVILISGSGPQNRDEELLGHKPFLVLSDYLTRQGIAVLRFDDRGVGKSSGNFKSATSADHASDVLSAMAYLKTRKEIKQIGLVGHSEGGMIAPMVAANNKDIAFIVLMAGPGTKCAELLLEQQALIAKVNGASDAEINLTRKISEGMFDLIAKSSDDAKLNEDMKVFLLKQLAENPSWKPKDQTQEAFVEAQIKEYMGPWPWMSFFLKYDPSVNLEKVSCPVLALNGEKDLQVPCPANLIAIEKAVKQGGNKDVVTKQYKNLNHLFQECSTGNPIEYATIEQTIAPVVLEDISKWIKKKVN